MDIYEHLLGEDYTLPLTEYYTSVAHTMVATYCRVSMEEVFTKIPKSILDICVVELVVYQYRLKGSEHLKQENLEGAIWSYIQDMPIKIKNILKPYRVKGMANVL